MPRFRLPKPRIITLFILFNLVGLWAYILLNEYTPAATHNPLHPSPYSTVDTTTDQLISETNDQLKLDLVNLETQLSSLSAQVSQLSSVAPTTTPIRTTTTNTSSTTKKVDSLLYVGNGTSTSHDWTDIPGASIIIDKSEYPPETGVRLESSISIVSGEAYARVKNNTTGSIYHQTQTTHTSSTSSWKTSDTFYLSPGSNEYLIQLRSSNGEEVKLEASRLRVTTN